MRNGSSNDNVTDEEGSIHAEIRRDRQRRGTSEPQTLSTYIQSRFDECSRSQKDVAQYIIDHLDEAAFQTAEELARRANTSSSTVVRFSQALGFEGFPELQRGRARGVPARARHGARPTATSSAPLFSLDQTEFETALAADHVNVEETARKVSRGDDRARDRGDRLGRPDRDRRAPTRWPSSPATCATC